MNRTVASQVANPQDVARPWRSLFALIETELDDVESLLRRELRSDFPFVDELVSYGCLLGGKRLRPALLLLVGKATGKLGRDHLLLAAVVEMIHTATLVHDDVLDEADMRRHLATVNARWDNEASVLLGDYLFTHSFYLASTLDSTYACQTIGRSTNMVCEGELRQINSRGNFALSEDEYLAIIGAKTAQLCTCCCRLGAFYAGAAEPVVEGMARFGTHLGIAFQIVDDLLDMLGDEASTGKSLGTDLKKRKPTLPLIRLLDQATDAERAQLVAALSGDGDCRKSLAPWIERYDAFDYARQKARWYAEQARDEIDQLPDSPARDLLGDLTELVITRSQ